MVQNSNNCVIGLDIGTTGAKAILTDTRGTVLGKGYCGYPLISKGSHIEQRAQDWIKASANAIHSCLKNHENVKVKAISLSTQGASVVALDCCYKPIGNAYTWMDYRATNEEKELRDLLGSDYFYRSCGWPISATLDAPKILYMKKQKQYENAKYFYTTLDYVNLFLTGQAVIDPTNAAIRLLYNIEEQDWDDKILDAVGIGRESLPKILPTGTFVGGLSKDAAAITGLPLGLPVYNGAHDQYCASIGASAINKGDMLISAGTTWVIMGISIKPLFTDTFIAPCTHPVRGMYGAMASLTCSGAALQWFKNEFISKDFREIDIEAKKCNRSDLFFFPYLSGANYPIWNLKARGAFTGVTIEHTRFDFANSIMEGVAFNVKRTLADFSKNSCEATSIKLMGGAAKSQYWTSLISDITDTEIELLKETEACAMGAAIIAACGAGIFTSYSTATKAMVHLLKTQKPDRESNKYFEEKYKRYCEMWDNISVYYR